MNNNKTIKKECMEDKMELKINIINTNDLMEDFSDK